MNKSDEKPRINTIDFQVRFSNAARMVGTRAANVTNEELLYAYNDYDALDDELFARMSDIDTTFGERGVVRVVSGNVATLQPANVPISPNKIDRGREWLSIDRVIGNFIFSLDVSWFNSWCGFGFTFYPWHGISIILLNLSVSLWWESYDRTK